MAIQVDGTAYANYLRSLELPPGTGDGFQDQAFPILYGLTRLRQIPLASRKAWHQALVEASDVTPDWAKTLPDGEYRVRMFILQVARLRNAAYGFHLDDEAVKKPNPEYPWSLWPWEWDTFAPRVLGSEGGEAATGQGIITPARLSGIIDEQWAAAKTSASGYLANLSPEKTAMIQDAYATAGGWKGVALGSAVLSAAFWAGVKAMSPRLAAALASVADTAALARKALASWPVTLATIIGVAAWDIDVMRKNKAVVMRYQADKARRDYEDKHPLSPEAMAVEG